MRFRNAIALVSVFGLVGAGAWMHPVASAQPPKKDPYRYIVSLGDSFISGEAGRWDFNALRGSTLLTKNTGPNASDRVKGDIDKLIDIYGDRYTPGGCHRSDVAEINSAIEPPFSQALTGVRAKNLACSGAQAKHIVKTPFLGTNKLRGQSPEKVEAGNTQAEDLKKFARDKERRIELIVLSIGGNDLNLSGIIADCGEAFLLREEKCSKTHTEKVNADVMTAVQAKVGSAIDTIRTAMTDAGVKYPYRILLQSYPYIFAGKGPVGSQKDNNPWDIPTRNRYYTDGERRDTRFGKGGCPFYNADIAWTNGIAKDLDNRLRAEAADKKVDFLSVLNAFHGHELCSDQTDEPEASNRSIPLSRSEWVRFVDISVAGKIFGKIGLTSEQGDASESLHPNARGQRVLGRCLAKAYEEITKAAYPSNVTCAAQEKAWLNGVTVTRVDSPVLTHAQYTGSNLEIKWNQPQIAPTTFGKYVIVNAKRRQSQLVITDFNVTQLAGTAGETYSPMLVPHKGDVLEIYVVLKDGTASRSTSIEVS